MGLETNLKVTCDYTGCEPRAVVEWNKEIAEQGGPVPDGSKYLIFLTHNGVLRTFCGQLHAAMFFLPPGYEVSQKKVVEIPTKGEFGTEPKPEEGD